MSAEAWVALATAAVFAVPLSFVIAQAWRRRCIHLPWHKWEPDKRLSGASERYRCTCGRLWAMNNDTESVLEWDLVSKFYEEREKEEAAK